MAGQPRWNAFRKKMKGLGEIDYICERVIAGDTIKTIAHGLGCGERMIYKYIQHEDNNIAYREARRLAADALVEQGQDIIDNADVDTSASVAKAKAQADYRRWRAGSDNREVYGGPQPAAAVQINLGSDFLGALRELGGPVDPLDARRLQDGTEAEARKLLGEA